MAITEFLDLKLLTQAIVKDEPKVFIDIEALLKREELLKEENEKE